MKVYTSKSYVLRTISTKLNELGDFKYFDILIFKYKDSKSAYKPESYKQLEEKLKDVDKVYQFNKVESNLHGVVAYDIIINEFASSQ